MNQWAELAITLLAAPVVVAIVAFFIIAFLGLGMH